MSLTLNYFFRVGVFASLVLAVGFAGLAAAVPRPSPISLADQVLPEPEQGLSYPQETTTAKIVIAGGCFWCIESVFEQIIGVKEVVSGYAGGDQATANYEAVSQGRTRHAESVQITFDPTRISFGQVMQVFFTMHHPTQLNGQTPDIGRQYRSAVFYANERERATVQAYIDQLNRSGKLRQRVVTTVEPLTEFYPAENYHQDYVVHHPRDAYVMQWAVPKLAKVKKLFPKRIKPPVTQSTRLQRTRPGSGHAHGSGNKSSGSASKGSGTK